MLVTYVLLLVGLDIREYIDAKDRSPFRKWFDDLNAQAAAKVTIAIARVEQGNLSNVKRVGNGVLEHRIDFGPAAVCISDVMATCWSSCSLEPARNVSSRTSKRLESAGPITNSAAIYR